jgi:hypothetical protein
MHPTLRQGLALATRVATGLRSSLQPDPAPKPRRRAAPQLDQLESRQLMIFGVKATIVPAPIWPPNNQYIPVTISGTFIEFTTVGNKQVVKKLPGQKRANFQVIDEYRQDEPFGPIAMVDQGDGTYTFSVTTHLQARRAEEFIAGRRYEIILGAKDSDGWGGRVFHVQVPHSLQDRGPAPIQPRPKPATARRHH